MRTINTEIKINAPVDKVWECFMDFENHKVWNPFFKQVKQDRWNPKKLHIKSKIGSFKPIILVEKENKKLMWEGRLAGMSWFFVGRHSFVFEAIDKKTTLFKNNEEFSGWLVSISFLWPSMEKQLLGYFDRMNRALKVYCEK